MLDAFGDDIWLLRGDPLRFFAIPFPTRSVVVRLGGGGIWLHSPVKGSPERFAAVDALGPIEHLVAPNTLHHLYVPDWQAHAPQARAHAAPGLLRKRANIDWYAELGDSPPDAWRDEIDQLVFGGSKLIDEVVFYHRASRSLIITDIFQNHDPEEDGWFWRGVKRLVGVLGPEGGAPVDWKWSVRDRDTARAARDRMLAWPFDRVVLSHGLCITDNARARVESAYAWLG